MSGYTITRMGESKARVILIVGYYQETIGYATYEDIAALSGRSLSRVRDIVNKMIKDPQLSKLISVEKEEKGVKIRLTDDGLKVYRLLKNYVEKEAEREGTKLHAGNLISIFDRAIYRDTKSKTVSSGDVMVKIVIDNQVANLNLPKLIQDIINSIENSEQLLVGVAVELVNAAQIYAIEQNRSVLAELNKSIINVPIRISRILDVSLPPHVYANPMPLEEVMKYMSLFTVWTRGISINDVIRYAKEGETFGILKLYFNPNATKDVVIEPRAGTGIDAVSRLTKQGFEVIASMPSRAWLPALSIYADITSRFPTVEEILNGEGRFTKLLMEHIGRERYRKWAEHMLGERMGLTRMKLTLKKLGAIDIFPVNGERRVLSLTAARHLLQGTLQDKSIDSESILKIAEERIRKTLEEGGDVAKIILEVVRRGFVTEEEMRNIIKNIIGENNESRINRIKWDIQRLGFVAPAGNSYYSAWTISPIFEQEDETLRGIYVWADRELSKISTGENLNVIRKLITTGEINLENEVGDDRRMFAKFVSIFSRLSSMGIVQFDEENLTVKLSDKPRSRIILHTALLEKMLGVRLISLEPRKGDENNIISTIIEIMKK